MLKSRKFAGPAALAYNIALGSTQTQCEQWDITKYVEPGHFANYRRGDVRNSERETALMVARASATNGAWPNIDQWQDLGAHTCAWSHFSC